MSTEISARHQAALDWAAAGVPVFPCRAGAKTPAVEHWKSDATTDARQIDAWWQQSDYNVAIHLGPAGLAVVDLDGEVGAASWKKLPPVAATYTQRTPRGGSHLVFGGHCRNTVEELGDKIDTRGEGGYILVAPSSTQDGIYEVTDDRAPIQLPQWCHERLLATVQPQSAPVGDIDLAGALARGRSTLENRVSRSEIAIAGRGGNNLTYQVACELRDLGLDTDRSLELLEEIWNPYCKPPWEHDELAGIVANAQAYGQNELGAWSVPPAAEVWTGVAAAKRGRFYAEDEREQEEGKEPAWLIPGLIQEASTVLLYGPTGSYKSSLALDIALSVATWTETFGARPLKTGAVFYCALEGLVNLKKKRRRAWKALHHVEQCPNFYAMLAPMIEMGEANDFAAAIRQRSSAPALIVLDTVAKCMMGLNENDAKDAGKFVRFCDALVEAFKCPVVMIGHTGKDEDRGHRGSGAFKAGCDTVLRVAVDKPSRAVAVKVEKHKDAEEGRTWTFQAKPLLDAMVMQETTPAEHAALIKRHDPFSREAVGGALQKLGSPKNESEGVSLHTLASEMTPQIRDETPEARITAVAKTERILRSLAKTTLAAYHSAGKWFLTPCEPIAPRG